MGLRATLWPLRNLRTLTRQEESFHALSTTARCMLHGRRAQNFLVSSMPSLREPHAVLPGWSTKCSTRLAGVNCLSIWRSDRTQWTRLWSKIHFGQQPVSRILAAAEKGRRSQAEQWKQWRRQLQQETSPEAPVSQAGSPELQVHITP